MDSPPFTLTPINMRTKLNKLLHGIDECFSEYKRELDKLSLSTGGRGLHKKYNAERGLSEEFMRAFVWQETSRGEGYWSRLHKVIALWGKRRKYEGSRLEVFSQLLNDVRKEYDIIIWALSRKDVGHYLNYEDGGGLPKSILRKLDWEEADKKPQYWKVLYDIL